MEIATYCAHCGDVCGRSAVPFEDKPFCCSGCRSVYELLSGMELCEYYNEDSPGVSMRKFASHLEFEVLDDPAALRKLLTFSSRTLNRVVLTVPTLHCASCVWLLEQLDRFDSGVLSSQVDIMRKRVTVDYNPERTSLRHVAEQMARVGYSPLIRMEGESRHDFKATRGLYARLGLAGFAAGNTMLAYLARYLAGDRGLDPGVWLIFSIISIALAIPVLLYSASPWFTKAFAALRKRKLTLDVPVALGIAVLFGKSMFDLISGHGEGYLNSFTGLVFFLLIGRLFQQKAFDALSFDRTYRSFFPLSVRKEKSGETATIPIEDVKIGDTLLVRNGEVIPCDAILASEIGYIDYSFVTGESMPVECTRDEIVHAGGRIVGHAARLVAIKTVSQSDLATMWERSSSHTQNPKHSSLLTLSDTFGKWFTAGALGVAVIAALAWLPNIGASFSVFTSVLIVACPCALTLAAPITLGTAMGRLGERGIFLKQIGVLLNLTRIRSIFFDKTGTLTATDYDIAYEGRPLLESERIALETIASNSAHPISRAIACSRGATGSIRPVPRESFQIAELESVREELGKGLSGRSMGHAVAIGSLSFISDFCCIGNSTPTHRVAAHLALDGEYAGAFVVRERLREGIPEMMSKLKSKFELRLISGDNARDRVLVESLFGEGNVTFEQTPYGKIARVEEAQENGEAVLMIGDGLNDAGAMSAADVAIAVTDDTATLVPACDIIVRADTLRELPALIRYAHQMRALIIISLALSVIYNIAGLIFAGMGHLTPIFAAVLMPASSITVIAISAFGARIFARRSAW